jgi:hypothetical protein
MFTVRDITIAAWSSAVGLAAGLVLAVVSWLLVEPLGTDAPLAFITSGLTGAGLGLAVGTVVAILVGPPPVDPRTLCPTCRYPIRDLPTSRCPECGLAR